MDGIRERPVFTQEQIDKEFKQVVLLDRILAENGALTFKQLYSITSKTDKEKNFDTLNDLIEFIRMRSNIFEVSFDLIRNHSEEFREMFGYLINFLCGKDPADRTMKVVFRVIMEFGSMVTCEVGNTEEKVRRFLGKHENFFTSCHDSIIVLNHNCLHIPSAWERKTLPTYKKARRFDRSIVLDGLGKVVNAMTSTGYIKIAIVRGPYEAQTVIGFSKNAPNGVNLAKKYPVGTLVWFSAHRVYEAAHPWRAVKVISVDGNDHIWCADERGSGLKERVLIEMGRADNVVNPTPEIVKKSFNSNPNGIFEKSVDDNASPQIIMESVNREAERSRTNSVCSETHAKMNSNYWNFYDVVIRDEIKKGNEVDECLRDGPKTFRQIFDKLIEGDAFAYYSYMVDFIVVRSHLYKILEDRVFMRSSAFRSEMLKFLRYIDEKSKENVTVNTLRKLVAANDGNFAEELLNYAENADKFLKFIEKHASLIELAEAFGEQFIFLRDHISKVHRKFINV